MPKERSFDESDIRDSHDRDSERSSNIQSDTLERILDEKTPGDIFATLDQTEKTPDRIQSKSKDQTTVAEKRTPASSVENSQKSTATQDQSFHSSRYSVDQSISLSAISGEFENKSVSLSESGHNF